MSQITTGVRGILSIPTAYSLTQHILGASRTWRNLADQYIRPEPGMRILDIGCGTGDLLEHLPDVDYEGFDLNPDYIRHAQQRYGDRGKFRCQRVSEESLEDRPSYDIVLAIGILHHIEDEEACHLFRIAGQALAPGGRVITMDPCYEDGQNPLARYLISKDRGQRVRRGPEYERLAKTVFPVVKREIRSDLLNIPYTHCILQAGFDG